LNEFRERFNSEPPYKRAVIFVDNSGADIVLGVSLKILK